LPFENQASSPSTDNTYRLEVAYNSAERLRTQWAAETDDDAVHGSSWPGGAVALQA